MEIEIIEKHDNLLLERTDVRVVAKHQKEATPKRKELKDAITEELGLKKEILVIDTIKSDFGKEETKVFAKVYKDLKNARSVEAEHVLKRNGLQEEKKKKEE